MTWEKDLQALRRNDERLTSLQLLRAETDVSSDALRVIVDALNANSRVKRVRLFLPRDFFPTNDQDVGEIQDGMMAEALLQAVGNLPQLEELKIDANSGMSEFPVSIFADIVARAKNLKELELWDLDLALNNVDENGGSEDLKSLELSLKDHPSLEKFTLYNCQLRENTDCTLDPLLHGLAAIPTLKQVYITAAAAAFTTSSSVSFTCAALDDLCRSKSLQELGLWKFNFPYSQDPISHMAPAIARTNILKMFEFGKCQLNRVGDEFLAQMLETNTSLEEIDLHLDSFTNMGGLEGDACEIVATAAALKNYNTTLKRLKLWGLMNRRNQEALAEMMRHNLTLETCRLLDADRDVSAEIDFFIGLNRGGRRHFLTNDTSEAMTEEWIDMLAGGDLSTIFYYLSMKPGLFRVQC